MTLRWRVVKYVKIKVELALRNQYREISYDINFKYDIVLKYIELHTSYSILTRKYLDVLVSAKKEA